MNLLTRIYLLKFSNRVGYCTGMRDYLKEETQKGNLNFKQLRYLYKNLYKKTPYIQQNIHPVSQAMIKGITIEEIEKISRRLVDAEKYTIFSVGGKNNIYNKLYSDLEFMFNNYAKWKEHCSPTTLHIKTFVYTKLLKTAREENKSFNESIYKYVERNFKNYCRFHKKMDSYEPIIKNIHGHRHSVADMYYSNNDKSKENEKDMTLSD